MKKIFFLIGPMVAIASIMCEPTTVAETRDVAYENYCDSVWQANPDYYQDVIVESDEYQTYIEVNGKWWEE